MLILKSTWRSFDIQTPILISWRTIPTVSPGNVRPATVASFLLCLREIFDGDGSILSSGLLITGLLWAERGVKEVENYFWNWNVLNSWVEQVFCESTLIFFFWLQQNTYKVCASADVFKILKLVINKSLSCSCYQLIIPALVDKNNNNHPGNQ